MLKGTRKTLRKSIICLVLSLFGVFAIGYLFFIGSLM